MRGSRSHNAPDDINNTEDIDRGVMASKKAPKETPAQPKMVTIWKCPTCKTLNEFGDSHDCANPKCQVNVGLIDDLSQHIMELEEDIFRRSTLPSDVPEPEEEKPLMDDEWICDKC